MNRPTKITPAKVRTFALTLLGIAASVGCTSLIAAWFWAITTAGCWKRAVPVLSPTPDPFPNTCLMVKQDRYDFKKAALEYHQKGYLEPPAFLISHDSRGPLEEMRAMFQERNRWEHFELDVIAEAKRQEAREAAL